MILSLLLALLPLARAADSAAVPAARLQAQQRYASGDYSAAAASYASLIASTPDSPSLHYNLGNSLFRQGRLGPAIAAYQRAYDLLPRDGDIRFNLDFALKRAGEELVPSGTPPLLHRLFTLLSESELQGLHWLFCWAALILAGLTLSQEAQREALKPWCAAALGLWLLAGGWWLARRGWDPPERGVIILPSAEIRSGPGSSFSVSFTAPEGRRVQILAESGGWMEIGVLREGVKGWIQSEGVEKI